MGLQTFFARLQAHEFPAVFPGFRWRWLET
jgi:hypothetical protein